MTYFALRRYHAGPQEMGSEASPEIYMEGMVAVFRELRRVLRSDGTLWCNISDTYGGSGKGQNANREHSRGGAKQATSHGSTSGGIRQTDGDPGNLLGIPERLALALQEDGWTWRSTVVWAKPAPMPESIRGWTFERHRVTIAEYARLHSLPEATSRRSQDGASRLQGVSSGTPETPERPVQADPALQRDRQGLCQDGGSAGEEPRSQGSLSANGEVPPNGAAARGNAGSQREATFLLGVTAREGEQPEVSSNREGQDDKKGYRATPSRSSPQRRRTSLVSRMGRNPDTEQAPVLLLREEGADDDGPRDSTVEGWSPLSGERGPGMPELQRHETRSPLVAPLVDCPGCPKCAPNDGLILRKGSWRATRSHEYIYQFTKGKGAYADQQAVMEAAISGGKIEQADTNYMRNGLRNAGYLKDGYERPSTRNPRSVQTWGPQPADFRYCTCGFLYKSSDYNRLSKGRYPECRECGGHRWVAGDKGRVVCVECERSYTPSEVRALAIVRRCHNCGKDDGWLAHFAAYPVALPDWCIRASTPEHGVCGECGAPWARVVDHENAVIRRTDWGDRAGNRTASSVPLEAPASTRTVGWKATCGHPEAPVVGALVCDPFSGTGTTLLAANRLGRRGIGIELNPEYAALSRARLIGDAPMLAGQGR